MLEEEEYLRTLIDADVSTLNGMRAGAIQDALKLLEAAQEAKRPDQDDILDDIDLFMEKEAAPNKPLQLLPTDAAPGIKPRADEPRVGEEFVRSVNIRCSPEYKKKK